MSTASVVTGKKPGKAVPKPMTKQRLRNIAKFHVERFATTSSHLRRVLLRRAERARRVHGGDAGEIALWVDEVVTALVSSGAVDDARYAAGRAITLRRLGKSPGKIRMALVAKGIDRHVVDEVLADTALTVGGADAALQAATDYARRRRLGPFRPQSQEPEERRKQSVKDMAALARAGFSYDIAKRVMAMTSDAHL
jgi:regulatory protein